VTLTDIYKDVVESIQQFQISCRSSNQNVETRGIRSDAGSFIFVMGKDTANLAASLAFSTAVKTIELYTFHFLRCNRYRINVNRK